MSIEQTAPVLRQKIDTLRNEIIDIQEEVVVLLAMKKKAEKEIEEIQAELDMLEMEPEIKLACAG